MRRISLDVDALGENVGIVGTWVEVVDISLPLEEDGIYPVLPFGGI